MINRVVQLLEEKKVILNAEPGNSMSGRLEHKETVILESISGWDGLEKGDIVFAKINGRYYTHLVHGVDQEKGILLGNNHGHVQGWTKKVYAKAHKIPKEYHRTNETLKQYLEQWKLENGYGNEQGN